MPHQILKAVAAALAAAGALASGSGDEVSLVQRGIEKADMVVDKAEAQQTAMALQTMLSKMHLEFTLRKELELADGEAAADSDADSDYPSGNYSAAPKCSAAERQNIRDKLASLNESITIGKRVEDDDYDATLTDNNADRVAIAMNMPWQCKRAINYGQSSLPWTLGPCTRHYFNVSKRCGWCSKDYLLSVIGFPDGCFADCLPLTTSCSSAPGSWGQSQACLDAATTCLTCGQPAWANYSRCVYGTPNVEPLMAMMDRIYRGLANGTLEVVPAINWVRGLIRNHSGLPNGLDWNRSHPNYHNPNHPNATNLSDTNQGDELKTSEGPKLRPEVSTTGAPKARRARKECRNWLCRLFHHRQ